MTKDEILTKAWEAGLLYKKDNEWVFDPSANPVACTIWFAEEVIFIEREACANVADALDAMNWAEYGEYSSGYGDEIRKRGIQ